MCVERCATFGHHHFTSPEEASELVRENKGFAFLPRATAWRIARDGLTVRPWQKAVSVSLPVLHYT